MTTPTKTFSPYTTLNSQAQTFPGMRFAENAGKIATGIELILKLVEDSNLDDETEGQTIPTLDSNDRTLLLRLAQASASLLSDAAEHQIDWGNKYASMWEYNPSKLHRAA